MMMLELRAQCQLGLRGGRHVLKSILGGVCMVGLKGILLLRRSRRPESGGLTARIRLGRLISILLWEREEWMDKS